MKAKKIDLIRTFELAFKKDLDEREFLLFVMARHGRDLPREEFLAAMDEWKATFDADYVEKKRQHEENQSMAKFALRVLALAGATEENGIKFGRAVEIAAKMGDPEAIAYVERSSTPEARIGNALLQRAMELHPDWKRGEKPGYWEYLGTGEQPADIPDFSIDMIDWLQRTHPHEARAIEDAVRNGEVRP